MASKASPSTLTPEVYLPSPPFSTPIVTKERDFSYPRVPPSKRTRLQVSAQLDSRASLMKDGGVQRDDKRVVSGSTSSVASTTRGDAIKKIKSPTHSRSNTRSMARTTLPFPSTILDRTSPYLKLIPTSSPRPPTPRVLSPINKRTTTTTKTKLVEFCPTPLGSLHAEPRHKSHQHLNLYHPYFNQRRRTHLGLPTPPSFVYSNKTTRPPLRGAFNLERTAEFASSSSPMSSPLKRGTKALSMKSGVQSNANFFSTPFQQNRVGKFLLEQEVNDPQDPEVTDPTLSALIKDEEEVQGDGQNDSDEEAESLSIEQLLLSPSQLSSSSSTSSSSPSHCRLLITPFSLSVPPSPFHQPKSILKKSVETYSVEMASDAGEGCKRNSGRVKHLLGFGEIEVLACGRKVLVPTVGGSRLTSLGAGGSDSGGPKVDATEGGESGEQNKENGRSSRESRSRSAQGGIGSGSRSGNNGENGSANGAGNVGASGSGSGGDRQPPSSAASTSKVVYAIRDDDPALLIGPLKTLQASLRPLSSAHIRAISTFNSPTSPLKSFMRGDQPSSLDRTLQDEPTSSRNAIPILTHEIEAAYVQLTRALLRIPTGLGKTSATLKPLRSFQKSLFRSLERDISHLSSFTSPVVTPTPGNPNAGSTLATLAHDRVLLSSTGSSSPAKGGESASPSEEAKGKGKVGLRGEEMRRQRDEIGAGQAAIKCFAALLSMERFYSCFENHDILGVLTVLLNIVEPPETTTVVHNTVQKEIYPFISWFLSVQRLPSSLLAPHIRRILPALKIILRTPDKPRSCLSESMSAIKVLLESHPAEMMMNWREWFAGVVEGLWDVPRKGMTARWKTTMVLAAVVEARLRSWGDGSAEVRKRVGDEISEEFLRILSLPRSDCPKKTMLDALQEELHKSLDGDEAPWVVNVLALIPAILGKRFIKLEPNGIRPWFGVMSKAREHPSMYIRNLGNLTWHHLISSFLRAPDVHNLMFGKVRPYNLMLQVFYQRALWSRVDKDCKDRGLVLARAFTAVVFGLTVVINNTPLRLDNSGESAKPLLDGLSSDEHLSPTQQRQFKYYDRVWSTLFEEQPSELATRDSSGKSDILPSRGLLLAMMASPHEEVVATAWRILVAITESPTKEDGRASLDQLLNPLMMDVTLAKTKILEEQTLLLARIQRETVREIEIPGWAAGWTLSRSKRILDVLTLCLAAQSQVVLPDLIESCVVPIWRNILSAIAAETREDLKLQYLKLVLEWLSESARLDLPVAPQPLMRRLTALALQDLASDSVISHPVSHGRLPIWHELLLPVIYDPELSLQALDNILIVCASQDSYDLLSAVNGVAKFAKFDAQKFELLVNTATRLLLRSSLSTSESVEACVDVLRASEKYPSVSMKEYAQAFTKSVLSSKRQRTWLMAVFESPFDIEFDYKLVTLLMRSSSQSSNDIQSELLKVVQSLLGPLFDSDFATIVKLGAEILAAASDFSFPDLFSMFLANLAPLIQGTSEDLRRFSPIFGPSLERALELQAVNSQATNPSTTIFSAVQSFYDLWINTFQNNKDLIIPVELIDTLAVLREVFPDMVIENLGSTQVDSQYGLELLSSAELPPPRQLSLHYNQSSTSRNSGAMTLSGHGYDADISTLDRSTGSWKLSSRSKPSPILGMIAEVSSDASAVLPSPINSLTVVDETSSEEQKNIAGLNSLDLAIKVADFNPTQSVSSPRAEPPARLESSKSAFIEQMVLEDTDDEEMIVTTILKEPSTLSQSSSHASSISSKAPKKRGRPAKNSVEVSTEVDIPSKRRKTDKASAKKRKLANAGASSEFTHRTPSPAIEEIASLPSSSTRAAIANFLALSFDGVVNAAGTPGLHRLIEMGERAKEFFKKTPSPQ